MTAAAGLLHCTLYRELINSDRFSLVIRLIRPIELRQNAQNEVYEYSRSSSATSSTDILFFIIPLFASHKKVNNKSYLTLTQLLKSRITNFHSNIVVCSQNYPEITLTSYLQTYCQVLRNKIIPGQASHFPLHRNSCALVLQ